MKNTYLIVLLLAFSFSAVAEKAPKKSKSALEKLKYKAGEEKKNDLRAAKAELLVRKSEKQAIAQVKRLLKRYKSPMVRADLKLRLAELHMRRSKTARFFELNRQSSHVVSVSPRIVRRESSKREIQKAINLYEDIQKRHPKFHKIDVAIFNNAFARQQLGQKKGASKRYKDLIKRYPKSPLIADSLLAIGEMAFQRKKFKEALVYFNKIKRFPKSSVYPYGLYKAAWTHYNMQNTIAGLEELEKVVDFGKYVKKKGLNARLDLRNEALTDMTLFFSEVYKAQDAYKYFQKQTSGPSEFADTIMSLGKIYKRHSRFGQLNYLMAGFIKRQPTSPVLPEFHEELVWSYESQKRRPRAVGQLAKYSKLCDKKSTWSKANKVGARKLCKDNMLKASMKLAKKWLKIWRKNKRFTKIADSSQKAFEIYFENTAVKDPKRTPAKVLNAKYVYADLLFQRNKFGPASESYYEVSQYTRNKKQRHDSAYYAIVGLEKSTKDKWNNKDEKRYKLLANNYLKKNKKGKYRLDVQFKMALIAYEKENFKEAEPVFLMLGKKYARTKKGMKSQDLYLDILNARKDFVTLKAYSSQLLAKNNFKKNPARLAKLTEIYEQSFFLNIQADEKGGKLKEAVAGYKKFSKENPKSPLNEKAMWNTMQLLYKLGDNIAAPQAAVNFYKSYPNSKQSVQALLRAASTYEETAQLAQGAKVLMILSQADQKNLWKYLKLASEFLLLSGKNKQAIRLLTRIESKGPADLSIYALTTRAKLIEEEKGRVPWNLVERIARTGRQPAAGDAQQRLAEYSYMTKNYSQAFARSKKVVGMRGASAEAKAKARYLQAEILADEYRRQSVKSRIERFTTVFAIKVGKLEKAQKAYQDSIRYGAPQVSVKSLERLHELYDHYAVTLKKMPLPKGLPKAEVQTFRVEMDKLAIPIEEKSIFTLGQAVQQARALSLIDGTYKRLSEKQNALNQQQQGFYRTTVQSAPILVPRELKGVGS